MEELSKWKAVQFRSFFLYVGLIALKQLLGKERYKHLLNLHVAIRLLTSENLTEEKIRYADDLLKYFVDQFGVCIAITIQFTIFIHFLISPMTVEFMDHQDLSVNIRLSYFWVLLKDLLDQDIVLFANFQNMTLSIRYR